MQMRLAVIKGILASVSLTALGTPLEAWAQLWVSSLNNDQVLVYQPSSGNIIGSSSIITSSDNGLSRPHGILDHDTGVIVASFGSNEIKRYERETGTFIDNFVPNTAGLNLPVYLDVGPKDGLLYVSSQGNDRILRFDNASGAAIDTQPFIADGLLDAPSGFDWATDGNTLYVAGRTSGNVLAYDAVSGEPLETGHEFATNLSGNNDTFGLKVDDATGDVFVASGGNVLRFDSGGTLLATVSITGLPIGLENGPNGSTLWVASNNTLYPIDKSDNTVGSAYLTGGTIATLNFFHFSKFEDPTFGHLQLSPAGENQIALTTKLSRVDPPSEIRLQWTQDFETWNNGPSYTPAFGGFQRNEGGDFIGEFPDWSDLSVWIRETDITTVPSQTRRFYRLWSTP